MLGLPLTDGSHSRAPDMIWQLRVYYNLTCSYLSGRDACLSLLCLSLSLLGGLTMPEWKGRVPLTPSHCERITIIIGEGCPRKPYANQIGDTLKNGQTSSTQNRRACMKRLMKVGEAKEVWQDRVEWGSVVSAYLFEK
ncbi:hypothetical protein EVAR_60076_1 [Eumeta japonica]|uniref:Uncharacterized protein n=1 Tax=Eumeta variegata TaxID=151549 RepID=A0A4C1YKY1_EUMVA|nr:hypothetical protein EVAR_60076_1 [Eumeta japonica]